MKAEERKNLAVDVAKLYYIEGFTQGEVAERTGMSRANISRILKKCVADSVVEIIIHDTLSLRPDLARSIRIAFGLQDVIIAPHGTTRDRTCRAVGGGAFALMYAAVTRMINRSYPDQAGYTAQALKSVAQGGLGATLGALLFGFVYQRHSTVLGYGGAAALSIAYALVLLLSQRRRLGGQPHRLRG